MTNNTQEGKCVDKSDVDVAYKEVGSAQGKTTTVDCKVRKCATIKREGDSRSTLECCAKKGARAGDIISWGVTPNVHLQAFDHFEPGHDPASRKRFPYTIDVRINRGHLFNVVLIEISQRYITGIANAVQCHYLLSCSWSNVSKVSLKSL